jgi:hypothetical protein
LTVFGIFAAIMGRHFALLANKGATPAAVAAPAATEAPHE